MDPVSVLRALWRQRWLAMPALLVALVAAGAMFQYGPRQYESTISYALVNPDVPTDVELEENPTLRDVNSDNPYLRASNPTLITDVLLTRLSSDTTADILGSRGLSPEYTVARGGVGNGFVLDITGVGDSPTAAQDTKAALAEILVEDLRVVQEVYGADPTYHFEALLIADSPKATEKFSSRLRAVISILLAGGILVFASVSLGEWLTVARQHRRRQGEGPRRAQRRLRRDRHVLDGSTQRQQTSLDRDAGPAVPDASRKTSDPHPVSTVDA